MLDACKEWVASFTPSVFTFEPADPSSSLDLRLGITLVAYSPLGRGIIGCDWKTAADIPEDDFRRYLPRFTGEAFDANMKLVKSLRELAAKKGITPNQLALKWVIDQGALPIPGTKRVKCESDASLALIPPFLTRFCPVGR